jgi:hypothetical protein
LLCLLASFRRWQRLGLTVLVFRSRLDLIAGQIKRDFGVRLAWRRKVEGAPLQCDFAVADAEKAAEIDDRGTHEAIAIDDYIDNAAHILVGGAQNLAAKNAFGFIAVEYGDRGRRLDARCRMVGGLALFGPLGIFRESKAGRPGGNENCDVALFYPFCGGRIGDAGRKSYIASAIQKCLALKAITTCVPSVLPLRAHADIADTRRFASDNLDSQVKCEPATSGHRIEDTKEAQERAEVFQFARPCNPRSARIT